MRLFTLLSCFVHALRKRRDDLPHDLTQDPRLSGLSRFGEGARFSHSSNDTQAWERHHANQ